MMLLVLALLLQAHPGLNTQPDDPTFSQIELTSKGTQNLLITGSGWQPYCPDKTHLVRMDTQPHCLWGTTPMQHKPNLGQFKCQAKKWYKHLPNCAVDPYFSIGIGQH